MKNKIICGDCLDELKKLPENSIDTIITDPPYGIGFMGKEWDNFKPKQNSTALIQFFQPIKMDYFVEKCAEVDDTTYEAIKTIICERLIGCSNINLEI